MRASAAAPEKRLIPREGVSHSRAESLAKDALLVATHTAAMSAVVLDPMQNATLAGSAPPILPHLSPLTPTSTSVLAAIVAVAVLYALTGKRTKATLPPGPPGLPFIGNIRDIPKSRPWVKFAEWTDQYGERSFVREGRA